MARLCFLFLSFSILASFFLLHDRLFPSHTPSSSFLRLFPLFILTMAWQFTRGATLRRKRSSAQAPLHPSGGAGEGAMKKRDGERFFGFLVFWFRSCVCYIACARHANDGPPRAGWRRARSCLRSSHPSSQS
jgi:hypothetical protein